MKGDLIILTDAEGQFIKFRDFHKASYDFWSDIQKFYRYDDIKEIQIRKEEG